MDCGEIKLEYEFVIDVITNYITLAQPGYQRQRRQERSTTAYTVLLPGISHVSKFCVTFSPGLSSNTLFRSWRFDRAHVVKPALLHPKIVKGIHRRKNDVVEQKGKATSNPICTPKLYA
jgi:hypothetical protein